MPNKQDKKRKTIKVQDLKPEKDAKGGVVANVHSQNVSSRNVSNRNVSSGRNPNVHI
jgi:hypothetical protein